MVIGRQAGRGGGGGGPSRRFFPAFDDALVVPPTDLASRARSLALIGGEV